MQTKKKGGGEPPGLLGKQGDSEQQTKGGVVRPKGVEGGLREILKSLHSQKEEKKQTGMNSKWKAGVESFDAKGVTDVQTSTEESTGQKKQTEREEEIPPVKGVLGKRRRIHRSQQLY